MFQTVLEQIHNVNPVYCRSAIQKLMFNVQRDSRGAQQMALPTIVTVHQHITIAWNYEKLQKPREATRGAAVYNV